MIRLLSLAFTANFIGLTATLALAIAPHVWRSARRHPTTLAVLFSATVVVTLSVVLSAAVR